MENFPDSHAGVTCNVKLHSKPLLCTILVSSPDVGSGHVCLVYNANHLYLNTSSSECFICVFAELYYSTLENNLKFTNIY